MADERFSIQFDDVPLEQARPMGRWPRMEPILYETLRKKIQSLSSEAVRVHLGPEITPTRMKSYLLRMSRDLNVPLTVRRIPDGLIFWRSTDEDMELAQEIAERLQGAQRRPQTRTRGRRPRSTR